MLSLSSIKSSSRAAFTTETPGGNQSPGRERTGHPSTSQGRLLTLTPSSATSWYPHRHKKVKGDELPGCDCPKMREKQFGTRP